MLLPDDVERLLAPIEEAAPAGAPIRFDPLYDKIREARREDDPSVPRGVWERPLKVADHAAAAELAVEALRLRSKDLQIAAWLSEAWTELHGLGGLTRGLGLVTGLCERYWASLFPELDEDGDDARGAVLTWLDEALASRLRRVVLGGERGTITLGDWERAAAPNREESLTRESLLARLTLVGAPRWAAVADEVSSARAALTELEARLELAMSAPVRMRRLQAGLADLAQLAEELLLAAGGRPATVTPRAAATADGPAPAPAPSGPIGSRAEAYRRLAEAAEYLIRTEPHSPVPYLVQRAIGWGNMSLAELLQEFISSADDLVVAYRLLGMRRRDE